MMTKNEDDSLKGVVQALFDDLRRSIDVTRYAPVVLALLALLFLKKKMDHQNKVVQRQWDEVVNVFAELWPDDPELMKDFIRQLDNDNVNLVKRFPDEFVKAYAYLSSIFSKEISENAFGNLFEYLLLSFTEYRGYSGGEAYTPRGIVNLMVNIIKPKSGEAVYDPVCGSGGFLLSAWDYVRTHGEGELSYVSGRDITKVNSCITRLNLIVHDVDKHFIYHGDSLRGAGSDRFDVIMANPPFSMSFESYSRSLGENSEVYKFGIPPRNRADYAFIQHALYHLKRDGRAAIIVAPGVLFSGGVQGDIRQRLVEENYVESVIALPANIFSNTGIAANILILKQGRKDSDILFIDASNEFKSTRQGRVIDAKSSGKIVALYNTRQAEEGLAFLATIDEVVENEFNLEVSRFVKKAPKQYKPLPELIEKQAQLEGELQELQNKMRKYIL